MKKFFKKYYVEIIVMVLPIMIFLIACLFNNSYPLGDNVLARYDGYFQYPGFTSYFRRVLLGQNTFFYSFKGLLGYNFYAASTYYLFNPTNLLVLFFDNAHIMEFYTFIIFLRISLCGFTMCKYLKYKFNNIKPMMLIIFSLCYSLCGYNVCYFFNYMYFDVVVLFPLVMIGLEKLIYEDKKKMYIICLSLSIISNFYIGYMVCIFSLLYFIYSYILMEKKNKKTIKSFTISSLLAGLLCMVVLIPVIYELMQGKADLYSDPLQTNYLKFNFNFLNIFYKFTPGSMSVYDIKYGTVNIYCSMLVLVLVIKYFFNSKISKKEKIVTGSFILFFLLSISFNLIDYAWHMFQCPIWYPNRYIFMFSFFLIIIACKSLRHLDYSEMKTKINLIIALLLVALMIYPLIKSYNYKTAVKIICYIFSIMVIFEYLFLINNKNAKILIIGLFFIEVALNTTMTIDQLSKIKTIQIYKAQNEIYERVIGKIKDIDEDNTFYRTELSSIMNYNSGASYDYNGLAFFSSVRNRKILSLFENNLGYSVSNKTNLKFDFKNPYINTLVGLKFFGATSNEGYYESISLEDSGGMTIYKNDDALSLGFMASKDIYNSKFIEGKFNDNIDTIVDTLTGKDIASYEPLKGIKLNNVELIEKKDKEYYQATTELLEDAYVLYEGIAYEDGWIKYPKNMAFYTGAKVTIDNTDKQEYSFNSYTSLYVKKGDPYSIKLSMLDKVKEKEYYDVAFIPYRSYKEFVNELSDNQMKVINYQNNDDDFNSEVIATKDKSVLMTTIPYDTGWTIYVDDKKIDYKMCYEAFICLDLDEGKHDIRFKYIPNGFVIGGIISGLSLISTIIYLRKRNQSN